VSISDNVVVCLLDKRRKVAEVELVSAPFKMRIIDGASGIPVVAFDGDLSSLLATVYLPYLRCTLSRSVTWHFT
jgi:hypothetical protein